MGYSPKRTRLAWEDRFRTPSVADLREHYNKQLGNLLDAAREELRSSPGVSEELSWQGLPWRWTIIYRSAGAGGRPFAYLVPDPVRPKLAIPLSGELVASLPLNRLKKHVRDGVQQARNVAGVLWATWELSSKTQLAEILELAELKAKLVSTRN